METRAHHILIGIFTLTAAGAVLLFTLWMSKSGTNSDFRLYDILFEEAVSGLSVGSPVQYSGIRVGEVERLTLDPEDQRRVWARVRISSTAPIKTDTQARLALLNITGASSIELSQGRPQTPLLTSDAGIPVIEAEPSSLAQLRVSSEEVLVSLTGLLERANAVLSEENAQSLSRVLTNLDTITAAVASEQGTLREGINNLARLGQELNAMLTRIDEQILPHGEPLLHSATAAMNNLEQFSQELSTLLQENREGLGNGVASLAELRPAIQDLRSVLNNLNDITVRLEEDPAGFLMGEDNIKEFQP